MKHESLNMLQLLDQFLMIKLCRTLLILLNC